MSDVSVSANEGHSVSVTVIEIVVAVVLEYLLVFWIVFNISQCCLFAWLLCFLLVSFFSCCSILYIYTLKSTGRCRGYEETSRGV